MSCYDPEVRSEPFYKRSLTMTPLIIPLSLAKYCLWSAICTQSNDKVVDVIIPETYSELSQTSKMDSFSQKAPS